MENRLMITDDLINYKHTNLQGSYTTFKMKSLKSHNYLPCVLERQKHWRHNHGTAQLTITHLLKEPH